MSRTTSQNAAILSLPSEILDMIWEQLSKLELKTTRLSCRFLNKLGAPILFAEFHLYPHVRSFEQLVNLSESEHIRHHVRILSFFPDYNGVLPRLTKQIESVWSSEISAAEKDRLLAHARLLESQTLRIDVPMDSLVQAEYLARAFSRLNHLESINLHELTSQDSVSMNDEALPHIYEQMKRETCGQYRHTRLPMDVRGLHDPTAGSCIQLLLVASSKLQNPLLKLEFEGFSWINFLQGGDFGRYSSFYKKHFANLKTLRLCGEQYNLYPVPGHLMQNLQHLLRMAIDLERLEISMDMAYRDRFEASPDRVASQIKRVSMFESSPWGKQHPVNPARLSWAKNLRQLALRGLRCTASEFKDVLRPCAATLEVLELEDIELLPENRQPNTPKACWVKVMKWMQRHLVKLRSVELEGRLTNGGMQTWVINSMIGYEECLLQRVYHFFLNGGPCPLDIFSIKPGAYDFAKKTSGAETPDYVFEDEEHEGDSSWEMDYDWPYDNEEDEEEESLMDDDFTDWNASDEELEEVDSPGLYGDEYW